MADKAPAEAPAGASLVSRIITLGLIILVPGVLGLLTFLFGIRPMLAPVAPPPPAPAEPSAEIAATEQYMEFAESQATLIASDPDVASPVLAFQVSIACKNPETKAAIEAHLPRFTAIINNLHRNRTRSEIADAFVQDTLLRQIAEQCNALLKRIPNEGEVEYAVTEALYNKFTIFDL